MKNLLTAVLLVISALCHAQVPQWNWAVTCSDNIYTLNTGVSTDGNNDVFITGCFVGSAVTIGNLTLQNSPGGSNEVYTAKLSPEGDVLWAKTASGDDADIPYKVKADQNGNVYVTGFFSSSSITFDGILLPHSGTGLFDLFLVKYDTAGNASWARSGLGDADELAQSISIDDHSNVILTGYTKSSVMNLGTVSLTNPGDSAAIFIAKYDEHGSLLWAKITGGDSDDYGQSVVTDHASNIYLSGNFTSPSISFGSATLYNNSSSSMFLFKHKENGNPLWSASVGGVVCAKICIDTLNNLYVEGVFDSQIVLGGNTLQPIGGNDVFIAKYDPSGNVLWAKSIGGNGDDYLASIITDHQNNILMTGVFTSDSLITTGATLYNQGDQDIFFIKFDPDGNEIWAKATGGTDLEQIADISCDQSGSIYAAGYYESSVLNLDTIQFNNTASASGFVAKLKNGVTAVRNLSAASRIEVYPNPSSGRFSIETDIKEGFTVAIYDVTGKLIQSENSTINYIDLNLSDASNGIYIFKISTKKELIGLGKIVLE